MKKIMCVILIVAIIGMSAMAFCGCGNMGLAQKNVYNYALTREPNGEVILHQVDSWRYDSNSIVIRTKCCNNALVVSFYNTVFYENLPTHLTSNYKACGISR